jgi:hemolysin activation/secretion protein
LLNNDRINNKLTEKNFMKINYQPKLLLWLSLCNLVLWGINTPVDANTTFIDGTKKNMTGVADLISQKPDPNSDRFPQSIPNPEPLPSDNSPVENPTNPNNNPPTSSQPIAVKKIQVIGSTVFSEKDFQNITQKVEGKTVTISDLIAVADQITQLYLDQGYITTRAVLVEQTIENGLVEIRVVEGTIQDIKVEGNTNIKPEYIKNRIMLGTSQPLKSSNLEDQLRLLRTDPLFKNVEASLRAGDKLGQSILTVRVTEAPQFSANIGIDNYSPPSIGSERLGVSFDYRNLTGIGDKLSGSYYTTTKGGADIFDFNYIAPINPMNGTVQLRFSPSSNTVVQEPFNVFNIHGESTLLEASIRQPLLRTSRTEFALSLAFAYQNGQTFTFAGPTPFGFGPDINGNSRTRVIKFGQDYISRDTKGAWALRSQFNLGTGWFLATNNIGNVPDGQFFSWLGQIQRVQVLSKDNFLIFQTDVQLSADGLLPSQQFVIGGGQSLRGYRQNVRAGDNGVRFSLEDRMTIAKDESGNSVLQFAPFVDLGTVWNVDSNPNKLPNKTFLVGTGFGVIWQPLPNMNVRLDYATPLMNLSDRSENVQDDALYFSVNYRL